MSFDGTNFEAFFFCLNTKEKKRHTLFFLLFFKNLFNKRNSSKFHLKISNKTSKTRKKRKKKIENRKKITNDYLFLHISRKEFPGFFWIGNNGIVLEFFFRSKRCNLVLLLLLLLLSIFGSGRRCVSFR
jgi:hypothetical protein